MKYCHTRHYWYGRLEHWAVMIVMVPTLSSLVTPQVIITKFCHNDYCHHCAQSCSSTWVQGNQRSRCRWSTLQWRHNKCDGVSNHRRLDCLPNRLFGCRSKKTSKLRVTGLCEGNSPGTGEFPASPGTGESPAQMASNAENVSIWWRHHLDSIDPVSPLSTKWRHSKRPNRNGSHCTSAIFKSISWKKSFCFQFIFYWSLFLKVQLTIS